jgi:hypothetical protein
LAGPRGAGAVVRHHACFWARASRGEQAMVAYLPQRCLKINWTSALFYWQVTSPHGAAWLNDSGPLAVSATKAETGSSRAARGHCIVRLRHRPGIGKGAPVTRWPGFRTSARPGRAQACGPDRPKPATSAPALPSMRCSRSTRKTSSTPSHHRHPHPTTSSGHGAPMSATAPALPSGRSAGMTSQTATRSPASSLTCPTVSASGAETQPPMPKAAAASAPDDTRLRRRASPAMLTCPTPGAPRP